MNLSDALRQIANYARLDADELIAYAEEDGEGGRNAGYDGWSIDPNEGKLLYALVRALKPKQAIEIGVHHGASTTHLLAAISENGSGVLDSYDLEANPADAKFTFWTFHQQDALEADFPPAEFVFEDGAHSLDFTTRIFEKLKAFAHIVVTHDTNMGVEHGDFFVKQAFASIFPDGMLITLDGCERGLGVWVNQEAVIADTEANAAYKGVAAQDEVPKRDIQREASKPPTRKPVAKRATRK